MNNRWFVSVLLIFTVLIVCIGGVSAADNISDNQSASSDVDSGSVVSNPQVVDSNDSVVSQENSISDDNQILGDSDDGIVINSSADLKSVLNDSTVNNTVIYLNNQSFVLNDLYSANNKNLTFCGGSSFDDGKTSILTRSLNSSVSYYPTYMYLSNGNITFKNIIFSDIICYDFISSAKSILTFENVSFINIKPNNYLVYNRGNCTFKDCNFVNSNGTIFTDLGHYSCLLDNCSFDSCDSMIDADYRSNSSNFNITNSRFNNCNGTLVYGPFNLKNCIINGTISDDNNYFSPVMYPSSVVNCTFINNIAYNKGGAIFAISCNGIINCTFINNSALYGGAIYDAVNSNISNCIFVNNSATIAGGAITEYFAENSLVNNCTFVNNSAGVCGGSILVDAVRGNFTVSNSTFSGNNASYYGNDIYYCVSRIGNVTFGQFNLLNNSADLELYINNDSAGYIGNPYSGTVVDFGNNITGFCIELNMPPMSGDFYAYFNNTNLAINVINHEYVGDYLKYLIYNYYGEIPNNILSYAIWSFTNYPYFDSNFLDNITIENFENTFDDKSPGSLASPRQLPDFDNDLDLLKYVVNDTLNSVDNGVIIPDNGATKLNDDGSYTVYDFDSIFSAATQNLITVKTSNLSNITPDISIIKITNNPVVYKGNDTSFDIVVTNNGTIMLSNVTVTEDSYDDLIYKSSSNITGNWTYNYVDGKHTWTLTGYLGVNQTARFNVVFTTVNSTIGNKTNTVSVTTNENVTGNASNITEVIENNTPETPENNTPNITENNTPNKPTPVDNGTVVNNNTPKADVKTTEATGYPLVALIIALIGIIGIGFRKK